MAPARQVGHPSPYGFPPRLLVRPNSLSTHFLRQGWHDAILVSSSDEATSDPVRHGHAPLRRAARAARHRGGFETVAGRLGPSDDKDDDEDGAIFARRWNRRGKGGRAESWTEIISAVGCDVAGNRRRRRSGNAREWVAEVVDVESRSTRAFEGMAAPPRKKRFAILTLCDKNAGYICMASAANKRRYADLHGYDFIVSARVADPLARRRGRRSWRCGNTCPTTTGYCSSTWTR